MNLVHLLPVGTIGKSLLESLSDALRLNACPSGAKFFPRRWIPRLRITWNGSNFTRLRFCSASITRSRTAAGDCWPSADVDLYIPILKYVFGEAQVGGPCALVLARPLHQEFYGLARDTELLQQRLLKESVHELGHTFGFASLPGLPLCYGFCACCGVDRLAQGVSFAMSVACRWTRAAVS